MTPKKDVLIVGGGIIGLSTAVQLAEKGAQVTVLEQDRIGHGCSYGNAGWLTPCFALPLPMPGMLLKSIKWMLNPEGPLYIKPSPDPLLLKWLTRFTFSMTEKKARQATEGLVELSKASLELYRNLAQEFPEIDFHQKGLLMIAQSEAGVDSALQELDYVGRYGIEGQALTPDEIRAMEPSVTGALQGGVYFPGEAHAEPLKIVQALAKKAQGLGVRIQESVHVSSFQMEGGRIQSLKTNFGDQKASVYVMATGSWSTELAREVGLSVPILGGKGYALILPKLQIQPTHPMMLIEKKVAVTPRQDSLRLAGTLELVNQDFSITERRVKAILRGTREFLTLPEQPEIRETWRGLRPCTPDGVPLIGFSKKITNLALACGHQMLGLQSGLGTGKLLAQLIMDGRSELDRLIYHPDRF